MVAFELDADFVLDRVACNRALGPSKRMAVDRGFSLREFGLLLCNLSLQIRTSDGNLVSELILVGIVRAHGGELGFTLALPGTRFRELLPCMLDIGLQFIEPLFELAALLKDSAQVDRPQVVVRGLRVGKAGM